mmetsp:Transcript_66282/g.215662  ORF Transcript_66282/g.215662 Transcript_66282/m.215662 type:complete len:1692 (-) Transcript_66282:108-5183(-)
MPPPRKAVDDGQATVHASFVPLSTPMSFASPDVVCCVVGSSVCLWNLTTGARDFIHTASHSISKICGNPAKGLVAFCEGGTSPQAFIYSLETRKQLFSLSNLTELELADMSFSACGSRLYALSRATSKRLLVFSTKTGQLLPGCDLKLPQRFDKIVVFPGHKDSIALVRSSSVRIVTIQKSYETYIMRLVPSGLPAETDLSVSAYAWTNSRHFLFATRQGALVTLDGTTGAILHAVQSEQPITSIAVTENFVVTSHIGNVLKFWSHNDQELLSAEDGAAMLQQMPPMEGGFDVSPGVFSLQRVADIDGMGQNQPPEERLMGQVAYLQATPEGTSMVLTTAEGEVWSFPTPNPRQYADGEETGEEFEIQDLQMNLLCWFHTHPVSDAVIIDRSSRTYASCDESGRLRLWQLTREGDAKGFRTLSFSSAPSGLCIDEEGAGMLVVGTDSGCVHLVNCPNWKGASVLETLRISEAGIAKLCNITQDRSFMWVAASLFDNRVAIMMIPFADPKIIMMGFVDVRGSADDICFGSEEFEGEAPKLIIAGCANESEWPCVWTVAMPSPDYEAKSEELPKDICPMWSCKLSAASKPEDKPTAVVAASHDSVIVGFAGGAIKAFPTPTHMGPPTSRMQPMQASDTFPSHDQLITQLKIYGEGKILVSSSMDGSIRKFCLDEVMRAKMPTMHKFFHNPYNGGVAQVFCSAMCDFFLTTGGSDGILVWSDPRVGLQTPAAHPIELERPSTREDAVVNVDDQDNAEFPIWKPVSADERERGGDDNDDPELNALALAQRRALTLEVENLRKKLRLLIEQNATCPELEQLERGDFCVDSEEKNQIAAKSKERCDALRAQIERENIARQLIRDRLIKEFWDPMLGKGCQICSLSSGLTVGNYPERTTTDEENTRLKKLRLMRKAEKMEVDMLKGPSCPGALRGDSILKTDDFTTGKEGYVVNWWHHGSIAQTGEAKPSDQKYLYEPFELLTNSRRRLQVHVLQALAAEYRLSFNELFKKCQGDKKGVMDQIKEKVARMKAILGELQITEEVPEPELEDVEDADAVLAVKDREIKVEKWISPEEQAAIDEAKRKEEERLRKQRENDAGQRALNQMMGGTLKTKKDLSALEITLDKEPWMDEIPEEEMTEVQLAALQEFQAKEKALAEEQDKYRKQLGAELKRLKSEVQDLFHQFETVLKELHHQRFSHDAKFFCQELYCVRLQLALLQSVEDGLVLTQSTKELEDARAKLADAEATLNEFSAKVNNKRAKQDDRVKVEKDIGSAANFRQQFASSGLEPEAIGNLLQLFRKRRSPERRASAGNIGTTAADLAAALQGGTAPEEDPYADLGTAAATAATGEQEDDMELECPDGIDDESFQRMLELRREKLAAEVEVQKGAAELQEMNSLLMHFESERNEADMGCKQLQGELEDHSQLMQREEFDIEILFKLKQGQVEVPQAAVVTDYSDAVVIDNEVVESRNRRILELGKDKTNTLETIKEFRKKLSLIQWEYKMLQFQTTDLEERTKDVHMLRVTKGLQSLLKGGEEGRNKADADLLERKIEHLNSNSAQKEGAMKKQYSAASHATKLRKQENAMLEKKLHELQQNVIQREHIRRLRAPQGGASQGGPQDGEKPRIIGGGGRIEENEGQIRAAQAGFREVKTRQALMEAARKHTEEIEILTKELDRLRQKTFPSFVQLNEDRGNPDHR